MKCVFRVDASNRMGIGHLMRCLTLAETIRERGADVAFVCREHPGHLIDLLLSRAMPVTSLPASPPLTVALTVEDYPTWLGVTQALDAAQTVSALGACRPDWLIVDHYGLDAEWEHRLRPYVGAILAIDDLTTHRHDCDVLLNQNLSVEPANRYESLVPHGAQVLLGPRYALLRREYLAYRETLRNRDGDLRRVLVFFGGADPHNMTGLALEALSRPECLSLDVDLVVGPSHEHRSALEALADRRPRTRLHGSRPHLADLMANADVGIGAGGTATWERMCLGLPSIVVSCADNQQPACDALDRAGLVRFLGHYSDVQPAGLAAALVEWKGESAHLSSLSSRGQVAVDGLGALRLAEVLAPTAANDLRLAPIPDAAPGRRLVLHAGALPVGEMHVDNRGDEAGITCSIDAAVDGRGWDARLLMMGNDLLQNSHLVRLQGAASVDVPHAVFLRLRPASAADGRAMASGHAFSIAILSDRESWLNPHVSELALEWLRLGHRVLWTHRERDLRPADFCFYLACGQIVSTSTLSSYRHNLVVHESDLPQGKGWSPLTWQILEGRNRIPVTLFEATAKVDSGVIYAQEWLDFSGDELIDELREAQAKATRSLCRRFIDEYPQVLQSARPQSGTGSVYRRRRPVDSRVDASKTIEEQFAAFRVADNDRYPAFFERRGTKYNIQLRKDRR